VQRPQVVGAQPIEFGSFHDLSTPSWLKRLFFGSGNKYE